MWRIHLQQENKAVIKAFGIDQQSKIHHVLWLRKFFFCSSSICRAHRGRQPLSQTHRVSSLGFSSSCAHMLILLCLCLSLCITVFAYNFRSVSKNLYKFEEFLQVRTTSWKLIKCLGSRSWSKPPQTRVGCPAVLPSVEESCTQLAEKLLHLTFSCSTQIVLRAHQGISVSPQLPQRPFMANSNRGRADRAPYLLEQYQ